ncbi:MAG: esterase-like activity of phytase family protein [Candidatus Saccharimonadales bacterium]
MGKNINQKWKASAKMISLGLGASLVLGAGIQAQAVTVSTIAGAFHERGALDGPGREARFEFPQGIVAAPDGTIYIADTGNDLIRKISSNGLSASTPTPAHLRHLNVDVENVAGSEHRARYRDGVGPNARFNNPEGLAISPDGKTLYVADSRNNMIRKIDLATKTVSTIAGHTFPSSGDGVGKSAGFESPRGLAISPDGKTLYVADSGNNMIRKIDLATSTVTTLAGAGKLTPGHADGVGAQATFLEPRSLAISADGQVLYIADTRNDLIRKMVLATNSVSTLAGHAGFPGTLNGPGPDAYFYHPISISIDGNKLYVADGANADIRMIDLSTGVVSTVAGATLNGGVPIAGREDGMGVEGHFQFPGAVTVFHGVLFVADTPADTIREVSF